jgi:hypothetical protein
MGGALDCALALRRSGQQKSGTTVNGTLAFVRCAASSYRLPGRVESTDSGSPALPAPHACLPSPTRLTRRSRSTAHAHPRRRSCTSTIAQPLPSACRSPHDRFRCSRRLASRDRVGDVPIAGDQVPGMVSSAAAPELPDRICISNWSTRHASARVLDSAIGESIRAASRAAQYGHVGVAGFVRFQQRDGGRSGIHVVAALVDERRCQRWGRRCVWANAGARRTSARASAAR